MAYNQSLVNVTQMEEITHCLNSNQGKTRTFSFTDCQVSTFQFYAKFQQFHGKMKGKIHFAVKCNEHFHFVP